MPRNNQNALPFEDKLVLQQWLFKLLEVDNFSTLQDWLKDPELEGFDDENISYFHHVLVTRLVNRKRIQKDDLLRYDGNIVRHWQQITEKRNLLEGRTLTLKYFQYLALLFTEIYLDRYFRDQETLLVEINEVIVAYNFNKADQEKVEPFTASELNKIAFWMATGSGKTLLMHCNLLQYQHYLKINHRENTVNRTILLTPNEGLSKQHLGEFELSNIPAALFSKQSLGGLFKGNKIEIIDIHKLADENGEKTVDVTAFEENNLVLVDEGHSGASGDTWMRRREALCENGFSFEYSATFGQAVKKNKKLTQVYAKSIVFDYSYRYFYYDGYGKEYRILNLEDDSHEAQRYRYLSACLLAFYQQQKVHQQETQLCLEYLLEKPLWVFVGHSVTAGKTYSKYTQEDKKVVSDVINVLLFLAEFVSADNQAGNTQIIQDFIDGKAGLLDNQGRDIFEESYHYLVNIGLNAEEIYKDLLQMLFNAAAPAKLQVENLKGSDGEIGIKLGDNEYFGLINVGDANALCKLCEERAELIVTEQPVSESIFQRLDNPDSNINILIGSRKFMQGWNSWRVSTMGLMNIGRGEGTQIIQLFGRGVRLKGKDFSLKRSTEMNLTRLPQHVPLLETLNIFGVRADYMRQFREFLEDEGLSTEEEKVEFIMPVIKNLGTQKLKVIKLKDGANFKKQGPSPVLDQPDDKLKRKPVVMDWYPRIQAISSINAEEKPAADLNTGHLTDKHIAFLDFDKLYFELEQFKNERNWHNLSIRRENIKPLLLDNSWYQLYIPQEELAFNNFQQVHCWQEIATGLLKKYCDQYYKYRKSEWESSYLEYQELTADDPNFIDEYRILVEKSREDIINKLEEIKQAVESGEFRPIEYQRLKAIMFERHLYQPLLYFGHGREIEIKPVALNDGERDFVDDLKTYYENQQEYFKGKELYLLRNRSRGRGIGFFEAGNFYPDFIMWLVDGDPQYVSFIDPKGIGHVGINDDKVEFYKTIKELEKKLGDPNVILNSFIISNTSFSDLPVQGSREDWEAKNVLFQVEDKDRYVGKIFGGLQLANNKPK